VKLIPLPAGKDNMDVFKENAEANLPLVKSALPEIKKRQKIYIIGAGPTLDEKTKDGHTKKEWLEIQRKDGWQIWCCDKAARCIHPVKPDLLFSVDPSTETEKWIDCYSDVPLIVSLKANPLLVKRYQGPKHFYVPWTIKDVDFWQQHAKDKGLEVFAEIGHVCGFMEFLACLNMAEEVRYMGCDYWFWGHEYYDHTKDDTIFICTGMYASPWGDWVVMSKRNAELRDEKSPEQLMNYDGTLKTTRTYPYPVDDNVQAVRRYTNDRLTFVKNQRESIPKFVDKYGIEIIDEQRYKE